MNMYMYKHYTSYINKYIHKHIGVPSVNQTFGNKLAVLGGDFLLSRASISLARLRNLEVYMLIYISIYLYICMHIFICVYKYNFFYYQEHLYL
jgi:hypothetical protein